MRFVSVCLLVGLAACQPEDPRVKELTARLDKAEARIETLEKRPAAVAAAAPSGRKRLDPSTVYNIPVRADDVVRGAADAKVTIVEGFDYACPHCANSRPVVHEVLAKHKGDVRVVSKQYVIFPDRSTLPALAVCAAKKQGKGAELEDALWTTAWKEVQPGRSRLDPKGLEKENIATVATGLGLDLARLEKDIESADCKAWLGRQQQELSSIGVSGTPAFFINGKPYQGPRTVDGFSAAVAEELKKKTTAM